LDTKEIIRNIKEFGQFFNVKSSLNNYKWILTKETIKIGNYNCFKAILKDKGNKKNETVALCNRTNQCLDGQSSVFTEQI